MNTFSKTISEKLSNIKPKDLVYPGILSFFAIIVLVLFSMASQFIAKNINNAFLSPMAMESSSLNMNDYTLVAKKLGITVNLNQSAAQQQSSATAQQSTIKDLSINIINASGKKGVATTLATAFENAGYAKATTGNQSKTIPTTTITIAESKASFGPAILEEVKKLYPNATIETATGTPEFDVAITIGGK